MTESWSTRLIRWRLNFFPAYRGSGARIDYIAADWREVRIRLPLTWRTRNYVGTIFGGSMFSAVDPIPMVMLIRILGDGFLVWDQVSTMRFLRPGRTTLFATIAIDEATTEGIKADVARLRKVNRDFEVQLKDSEGLVHAICTKTLYIRRKQDS
jgi:acyl-coenzyme A thioesterase PaaI-like protein